jgi:hypothetical protein
MGTNSQSVHAAPKINPSHLHFLLKLIYVCHRILRRNSYNTDFYQSKQIVLVYNNVTYLKM